MEHSFKYLDSGTCENPHLHCIIYYYEIFEQDDSDKYFNLLHQSSEQEFLEKTLFFISTAQLPNQMWSFGFYYNPTPFSNQLLPINIHFPYAQVADESSALLCAMNYFKSIYSSQMEYAQFIYSKMDEFLYGKQLHLIL